jgi:putative salt-induced outer membrane protein YdiY
MSRVMPRSRSCFALLLPVLSLVLATSPAFAQDPFTWENATELSFVTASGNQSSSTLGLKSSLEGANETSGFKLELGGIRASSTFTTRTAVGTPTDFVVTEVTREETSAENYFARSRYTHDVGSAFAFGGAGWERNTFSGIRNRFSFVGGLGKTWVETDEGVFKTDLGATYTIEKPVEETPGEDGGFGGLRATIEAERALTGTTDFSTTLVADENLAETDDLRVDWVGSITVALTEGLAFKTSYQVLFDNDPALIGVPLFDGGGTAIGQVRVASDEVDTFLTLSLVIKL